MMQTAASTISEYIAGFPKDIQKKLKDMRATIQKAAPRSKEAIKYAMPTFVLDGNLVHFAAFKNHIGFYPAPSGIYAFKKELEQYQTSKGAIQFPLDKPIPLKLVAQIVKFRALEMKEKADRKAELKAKKK